MVCKCQGPSYVEGLALRVHPMDGHRKLFAMMQAYLDESGIDVKSKFCVLAGYRAGTGQWKRFERTWKPILRAHSVTEFHAKRFFARDDEGRRVDEYKNWSDAKADAFINQLLGCITDFKIYPISCTVVVSEWNKLSYGERCYLTGGTFLDGKFITSGCASKPYYALFGWCIYNSCRLASAGQRVHFAFDLNKDLHGYGREYFKFLKNIPNLSWGSKLGEPSWPTSLEAVQLQAADLFAYLMLQFCPERLQNFHTTPGPMLTKAVYRGTMPKTILWLGGDDLDLMLSDVDRRALRQLKPPEQPKRVKHYHLNGLA